MAKAIDPFEEYLRKKKVEMLEEQYRSKKDRSASTTEGEAAKAKVPTNDDPEVEARLKEEVEDFFQDSQSAAAELFTKAASMSDDKVEEIKEALDEVFEEDEPRPQTAEPEGGTFVDFFRQVQEEFPGKGRRRTERNVPIPRAASAPSAAAVEVTSRPAPAPAPPPSSPPVARPAELLDFDAAATEVSTEDLGASEDMARHEGERLSLAEILLAKPGAVNLERKVEVLCRLVGKLAERANLPENELIEALIKAGVEF